MRPAGFYEAGYVLTPERTRLIIAEYRQLRAFALLNHLPPDSVLPEDMELLRRVSEAPDADLAVDVERQQAYSAFEAAEKKRLAALVAKAEHGIKDWKNR